MVVSYSLWLILDGEIIQIDMNQAWHSVGHSGIDLALKHDNMYFEPGNLLASPYSVLHWKTTASDTDRSWSSERATQQYWSLASDLRIIDSIVLT